MSQTDFNCMLDLETLSRAKTAAIASIGAVKFNDTEILEKFYINIDPRSCKEAGLNIELETIEWWKQQKPEAYASLKTNRVSLVEALTEFSSWFGPKSVPVWANAPTFDCVILDNAYQVLNMQAPWEYWDERCYRTICNLFGKAKIKATDRELHHNALDDAIAQTNNLLSIFRK